MVMNLLYDVQEKAFIASERSCTVQQMAVKPLKQVYLTKKIDTIGRKVTLKKK